MEWQKAVKFSVKESFGKIKKKNRTSMLSLDLI